MSTIRASHLMAGRSSGRVRGRRASRSWVAITAVIVSLAPACEGFILPDAALQALNVPLGTVVLLFRSSCSLLPLRVRVRDGGGRVTSEQEAQSVQFMP